jgi:hypothetical protein
MTRHMVRARGEGAIELAGGDFDEFWGLPDGHNRLRTDD